MKHYKISNEIFFTTPANIIKNNEEEENNILERELKLKEIIIANTMKKQD